MRRYRLLLKMLIRGATTFAVVAMAGALLIRFSPGFDVDERELDARLSPESRAYVRQIRDRDRDVPQFLARFAVGLMRGDLGMSIALNQPVQSLIADRLPVTACELGPGVVIATGIAGLITVAVSILSPMLAGVVASASSLLLCIPSAVLGYATLWFRWPIAIGVGLAVFPHLFQYFVRLAESMRTRPHLIAARARGTGLVRISVAHIMLPCVPEAGAGLGMAMSIGLGSSVPLEYVTGRPGIGQLAWVAASGRDLPVLLALTLIAAAVVLVASFLGDLTRLTLPDTFGNRV